MSDQPASVSSSAPRAPESRGKSRIRTRRLLRIGCLPVTLGVAFLLIGLFGFLFSIPPTYVRDRAEYQIAAFVSVSLIILLLLQLAATWLVGLLAANAGAQASKGSGQMLVRRLRVVRQRLAIPTLSVVLLRLGVVLVITVASVFAYTNLLSSTYRPEFLEWLRRDSGNLYFLIALLGVALPYWLGGPFLRMRFSAALGALAGSWAKRADERTSYGLAARLGAGFAAVLAAMWGGAIGVLVVLSIVDPISRGSYYYSNRLPADLPALSSGAAAALLIGSVVLLAGTQVGLSILLTSLTRTRLQRKYQRAQKNLADPLPGTSEEAASGDTPDGVHGDTAISASG